MNTLPFDVLWKTTEYFDIETLNAFGRVSTDSTKMLAQPMYDKVWLKTFEKYSSTWDDLSKLNSLAGLMNIHKVYRQGEDPVVKAFQALPMLVEQSTNRKIDIQAGDTVALITTEGKHILCDATMSSETTLQGKIFISKSGEWILQPNRTARQIHLTHLQGTKKIGETLIWPMDKPIPNPTLNVSWVGNYICRLSYHINFRHVMTFSEPSTDTVIRTYTSNDAYPVANLCTDEYMVMKTRDDFWLQSWTSDTVLGYKRTIPVLPSWITIPSKTMFYYVGHVVFKQSMMNMDPPEQVLVVPQDQGPCFAMPNVREDVIMTYNQNGVQIYHQGVLVRTVPCFSTRSAAYQSTKTHLYIECCKFSSGWNAVEPEQDPNAKNYGVMRIPMD